MSVILGIKIERTGPLGELRKELPRVMKQVMLDVGNKFAKEHVVERFRPENRQRFKNEKRNDIYAKEIKKKHGQGEGKHVDNVLTGRSKRQAQATVKVSATRDRATVRTTVPGYFKKPFTGTYTKTVRGKDGKLRQVQKRITHQPDKVKEVGQVDNKDSDRLTKYALRRGRTHWRNAKVSKRKKV